jgi:CRISPR system Cascade subunit CasE
MIYLSQLLLDPSCPQVQAELRDPYQMHRTLSKGFGDGPAFAAARCLFRVDEARDTAGLRLLIQSLAEPDWQRLTARRYLLGAPQVRQFEPAFEPGQRLAFRLRANPTVKHDGKRLALYREEEHLAWLQRKAQAAGFVVSSAVARLPQKLGFRTTQGLDTCLFGVTFDGRLRVSDPHKLVDVLARGIGSAKAFGFGLLSVAPVS